MRQIHCEPQCPVYKPVHKRAGVRARHRAAWGKRQSDFLAEFSRFSETGRHRAKSARLMTCGPRIAANSPLELEPVLILLEIPVNDDW
jgi:hypothetical protein